MTVRGRLNSVHCFCQIKKQTSPSTNARQVVRNINVASRPGAQTVEERSILGQPLSPMEAAVKVALNVPPAPLTVAQRMMDATQTGGPGRTTPTRTSMVSFPRPMHGTSLDAPTQT